MLLRLTTLPEHSTNRIGHQGRDRRRMPRLEGLEDRLTPSASMIHSPSDSRCQIVSLDKLPTSTMAST